MINFIKQVLGGKTIYRVLMERELERATRGLSGRALDLASGTNPSYWDKLPKTLEIEAGDIKSGVRHIDFNHPLPFASDTFDVVLLANAIYIAEDRRMLLSEMRRVLKQGGKILVVSPYIANVMPDPDDFVRLTEQGHVRELEKAGFERVAITSFGERAISAVYIMDPFWLTRLLRLPVYALALALDKCIPSKIKRAHPTPLGYVALAQK